MANEYLAYDVARCNGTGANICADCLRRTVPGRPEYQAYFMPFSKYFCSAYIAPTHPQEVSKQDKKD